MSRVKQEVDSLKRGVELSMNVIIIAAIALIVLVILVLLVTKAGENTVSGTSCSSQDGAQCVTLLEGETCANYFDDSGYRSSGLSCRGAEQTCCYKPIAGGDE